MMRSDRPIHIGVLFSKTGWTAATERSMLSATKFAIDEINEAGGINGRQLVPIYGDPEGKPSAYQDMARELLSERKASIILGCYTSSQRKAVLSVLDREHGLLCYPAQYEGFEYSRNIVYFGAVPNQNSFFLGSYLLENFTPRLYIVGSDYVWPRESGRIMADLIRSRDGEIVGQHYLREEASFEEFDALIKDMKSRKPDIVFNNFVGNSNVKFYQAYADNGLDAYQMPVASLTTSETDIREIAAGTASGHITAATYFQSQTNLANRSCLERYQAVHGEQPNANMGWEAAYTQAHVVAQAMRQCDSDNVNLVRAQILGSTFDAPQGVIAIDPLNSHAHVWPKIGVVREDGQFDIVAETSHAVPPDPYRAAYFLDEEDTPLQPPDLPKTLRADSFGAQE